MNNDVLNKLSEISLFQELKDDKTKMTLLVDICRVRDYKKGQTIIEESDLGSEMFIALSGGVEIKKKTRAGDQYTVVQLKSSDNIFFGELALIDDDKRSATVSSIEDSSFIVISKKDFISLGNQHPEIGLPVTRAISRILASRMRKTTSDMLTIFDALVNELES